MTRRDRCPKRVLGDVSRLVIPPAPPRVLMSPAAGAGTGNNNDGQ